jgi:predicted ATPase
LRPVSSPRRFEFAHALVREAVLDECNVLRRARLHRRAADALAELGEEHHLEEIAMHLFEAASTADAHRAATMLVGAGHRALNRLAYEDAAERFDGATRCCARASPKRRERPSTQRAHWHSEPPTLRC